MKILGEIVELSGQDLYIPWFHRVAPSLQSKTWVHGVLVPGNPSEIFLSPYPVRSWTDLWCLECEFIDRPGLFAHLTRLLGDESVSVNILAHESSTLRHENSFQVTLICDMSGYGDQSNPDQTSFIRADQVRPTLQYLCDYITIEMFDDLVFRRGRPQISAVRLRELHRVGMLERKSAASLSFKAQIFGGSIKLDKKSLSFFKYARSYAEDKYWVTIASDTEERYIRLMALPQDRDPLLISIPHTDESGQIARFSEVIASFGTSVNIHCSYLRLQEADGLAVWRCLLDMEAGSGAHFKAKIVQLFQEQNRLWRDPLFKVEFPEPIDAMTEPWRRKDE